MPGDDVQAAVAALALEQTVVLRALLCGFDTAQLASLTGVPSEAVGPILRVAVAKLARGLDALPPGPSAVPAPSWPG